MRKAKVSSLWLSSEMARALAAGCPPLKTVDVVRAADTLSSASTQQTAAINHLLRDGTDLMRARRVVEALCALRDLVAQTPTRLPPTG